MGMFVTDAEATEYIYGQFKAILEGSPDGFYVDITSIGGATPESISAVSALLTRDGYRVFTDSTEPTILHIRKAGIVETALRKLKEALGGDK